ncbi:prolyl oligopeptidase family serine peptidase [Leptobacterium flavescens]|uniref:Prolyl oligopeptidase family serine peptidase n=1 Tax=Leptobacterium flavescens TaxID=472055 RepID=A0A6P0UTZ1_9FLAO|nr:prolyl oligopeptidase family serine peptidase [Leptobacterium flavescens]NER15488.1 prolyl oligopeptidase family serine peptidase [Leptobacterium flavescens]
MKKQLFVFSFIICLLQVQFSVAQNDPSRWTPEDIINTESIGSVSVSPDGNMVLWTKRKGVKKKDRFVSDIYLTRLNMKKDGMYRTVQLTNGDDNDYSPIFSRDGESIYFLSSRAKGNKLWKMSIYGGEASQIKEFKNGISGLQWKDKNTLLFRSNDGKTLYESELETKKDNVIVVEDSLHWKPNHIYAFNLKDKSVKRLTSNKKPLGAYTVSPDGKWLVYSMGRSRSYASDAQKDPYYFLVNLEQGTTRQIITDLEFPSFGMQFSKDSKGFYFMSDHASDPKWNGAGITELYYYTISSNSHQKVNLRWDMGMGRGYDVVGNDVIVSLANRATLRLAYYRKNGNSWSRSNINLGEKNDHTSIYTVSDNGDKVVYQYSTSSKLPKFFIADLNGNKFSNEQELVKLNKGLAKKSITRSEVMTWKGYKGEEVTGLLYYPENYQEGKRYPLMLSIHGGPAGADLDLWSERWSTYPNLLAQKGMFVLKPNYHGSSNHGLSFVESIKGNYYEPEMEDIVKGIEVLHQQGKIDKSQMGTMGWSNGAIITTMLTVRYPEMFKVAAPGAGDVNWTSDFGTCRFGVSFDQSYFGGAPWDDVDGKFYNEKYLIKSPLFEIEKIRTPTIIFHGSEDRAVPRDQGWEYYRGLQQVGKTPVRFLWFPGQPHGLGKITHQLRKMKEEITWIETYLLSKSPEKNEAFKKDSPLASLLKVQQAGEVDGLFGEMKNGILIPETVSVKKDSISLGRFEVTNAQFKAFKPAFNFKAGQDNYPAVVSHNDAKAYVNWLSQQTGDTYRLPTAKEAENLHKKAHKAASGANTLNYWAGYAITKDEVPMLKEKLKELKSTLLKKAGKNKSTKVGEAEIYDLGGNVAEYYDNGSYGYSAYDFHDKHDSSMINSKYVGIRVVKE